MPECPEIDPAPPIQFVINAAAGSSDAEAKRGIIEAALQATGRRRHLLFSRSEKMSARTERSPDLRGPGLALFVNAGPMLMAWAWGSARTLRLFSV